MTAKTGWYKWRPKAQRRLADDYGFDVKACERMTMRMISLRENEPHMTWDDVYWAIVNEEIAEPYQVPRWDAVYA